MPSEFIFQPVTEAVFATLVADDWPNGTVFAITDDGDQLWEVRGADGAKAFVPLHQLAFGDLTDVDMTTTPPTDGQVAVFDAGTSTWLPGDQTGGGGGGGGTTMVVGAEVLIEEQVVGAGGVAQLDFALPSGYDVLRLEGDIASDRVAGNDKLAMRLGTGGVIDTAANYRVVAGSVNGSGGSAGQASSTNTFLHIGRYSLQARGAAANDGQFSYFQAWLPNYEDTDRQKTMFAHAGSPQEVAAASVYEVSQSAGVWDNTAVADIARLFPESGPNFVEGSKVRLIGITYPSAEQVQALTTAAYTETVGDGVETEFTIDHNLASNLVDVMVWDLSVIPNELVGATVERVTVNQITVTVDVAPATDELQVVVHAPAYLMSPSVQEVEQDVLHVRDEKAAGTAGGTFTSGAWQTRVLNTVANDGIAGASLAANQVTLPAGRYWVEASAPAFSVNRHQLRLRDITAGANLRIGSSNNSNATSGEQSRAFLSGFIDLAVETVIELQHRCGSTLATNGFGLAVNFAEPEVYADIVIRKAAITVDVVNTGGAPGWLGHLVEPDDNPSEAQEFNSGAVGGTLVEPTGTTVWTQKRSLLSVKYHSQAASGLTARLFPLSGTWQVGSRLEAAIRTYGPYGGFGKAGICLADGTTDASNMIAPIQFHNRADSQAPHNVRTEYGTFTVVTGHLGTEVRDSYGAQGGALLYVRITYVAADTWLTEFSPDGVTWIDMGIGNLTRTLTPTHYGVVVSRNGSGAVPQIASWEFLRVYDLA